MAVFWSDVSKVCCGEQQQLCHWKPPKEDVGPKRLPPYRWMLLSHTAGMIEDWWGERGDGRHVRSVVLVSASPLLFRSLSWSFHPCRRLGSLQYSCLVCQHPSALRHVVGVRPAVWGRAKAPGMGPLVGPCLLAGLLPAWGSAAASCVLGDETCLQQGGPERRCCLR